MHGEGNVRAINRIRCGFRTCRYSDSPAAASALRKFGSGCGSGGRSQLPVPIGRISRSTGTSIRYGRLAAIAVAIASSTSPAWVTVCEATPNELRQLREVRAVRLPAAVVLEAGRQLAPGEHAVLDVADRAIALVVPHHPDHGDVVFDRGGQGVRRHQERAVAHHGDAGPVRRREFCAEDARGGEPHRGETPGMDQVARAQRLEQLDDPVVVHADIAGDDGVVRQRRGTARASAVPGAAASGRMLPDRHWYVCQTSRPWRRRFSQAFAAGGRRGIGRVTQHPVQERQAGAWRSRGCGSSAG